MLLVFSRDLNILSLGEEKALNLGVKVTSVRKILFITDSFISGGCVAVSGIIGFVGLIIPNIMRKLLTSNYQVLLPACCLGGAIFLVLSDSIARIIIYPLALPVGVITGIFGGIFFLSFLFNLNQKNI